MLSQQGRVILPANKKSNAAAAIIARQDRIPIWALPNLFIGLIGLGFLFTFFDIGDVNVSFVQTCVQIIPGCSPHLASKYIGLPVLLNLAGYVMGALAFGPLADRYGRRDIMVITMVLTGLGSLYTAFVGDYLNFIISRTITGIGIGADLALVNTYVNEVAPSRWRAQCTSLIFILSTVGAALGVWLGLYLTTPATPFPNGLPFALATPEFNFGWRILYAIGASLSFVGLLLRFNLPESPRWLITRGRISEAERVVASMEKHAQARMGELPPAEQALPTRITTRNAGYSDIFSNALYFKRTIILLVVWLLGYITVYSNIAGETVLLVALKYPVPEAGLISALGVLGGILSAFIAFAFGERLERKYWLLISSGITIIGGVIIAQSSNIMVAVAGSIILSCGSYLWIPIIYTWTTENFPTRARASGFALTDGIGHIGGGIGVSYITALVVRFGPLNTFLLISGFLLVASWLAQFGSATRNKRLDEVSP